MCRRTVGKAAERQGGCAGGRRSMRRHLRGSYTTTTDGTRPAQRAAVVVAALARYYRVLDQLPTEQNNCALFAVPQLSSWHSLK